mmetsp:Transcript_11789/g.25988  ORF Transcript_11789/g.25988 Transcript_11789/m.25988 type:complete len:240 (+) Transcript_11789:622-1341(+)
MKLHLQHVGHVEFPLMKSSISRVRAQGARRRHEEILALQLAAILSSKRHSHTSLRWLCCRGHLCHDIGQPSCSIGTCDCQCHRFHFLCCTEGPCLQGSVLVFLVDIDGVAELWSGTQSCGRCKRTEANRIAFSSASSSKVCSSDSTEAVQRTQPRGWGNCGRPRCKPTPQALARWVLWYRHDCRLILVHQRRRLVGRWLEVLERGACRGRRERRTRRLRRPLIRPAKPHPSRGVVTKAA